MVVTIKIYINTHTYTHKTLVCNMPWVSLNGIIVICIVFVKLHVFVAKLKKNKLSIHVNIWVFSRVYDSVYVLISWIHTITRLYVRMCRRVRVKRVYTRVALIIHILSAFYLKFRVLHFLYLWLWYIFVYVLIWIKIKTLLHYFLYQELFHLAPTNII